MKILQICNRLPFPLKDGYSIAAYNFTKGSYKLGHNVILLAMNTSKHFVDPGNLPDQLTQIARIHTCNIDNKVKPVSAFLNIFSSQSYHIQRYISTDFEEKLIEILKNHTFDIIQLEGLYVSPYVDIIKANSKAKIVMRAHNVEYLIWERLTREAKGLKKWYLSLLASRLKKYELDICNSFDLLFTFTQEDKDLFIRGGCNIPIHIAPIGLDVEKYKDIQTEVEFPSLFFLGSLEWMPNIEGVKWFLGKVWPTVHQRFPTLKFYIAGRNPVSWLKKYEFDGVEIVGEIEDALTFIKSKAIMVVPLLSGGGMRVKIIEGMALRKAIITTSIGAEGIENLSETGLHLADTAEEFADAIAKCIENKEFANDSAGKGYDYVKRKFSNDVIVKRMFDHYIS